MSAVAKRPVGMTVPQMRRKQCTIHLRPMETQLLSTLLISNPDFYVTKDELIEALWPDPDQQPDDAHGVLTASIGTLRAMGVLIETRFSFGWRIPHRGRI